jgi:hypothetical protein
MTLGNPSAAGSNSVYIITIQRAELSDPETYYVPAPTAEVAKVRVRRLAKAPSATILNVHAEKDSGQLAS